MVSLATELDVASETIRRDLKALASRRLLKRVHGGAVPLETAAFESGVEYRSQVDLAQKHRIAAAAAGRHANGDQRQIQRPLGRFRQAALARKLGGVEEIGDG